jgi:oligopeptide/dipeptide ABC transporter ATP-binding protein
VKEDVILDIRDLKVHIHTMDGVLKVLDGISLNILPGEIVGLVGESGCGKSMTSKVVLNILPIPPARILGGEVYFLGRGILSLPEKEKERIKCKMGYIPQDPMTSFNPVYTVGEILVDSIVWRTNNVTSLAQYLYLRRVPRVRKKAQEYAVDLLRKVNIPDPAEMMKRYPLELSGGMRQRVLIAMALVGESRLLVADEPTTALDVTIQKAILCLLREKIEEEKLSGLYITHDLGVAREICHRTYVMYAGTIVESAETSTLLDNPLHPYTKGLINAIPKLTGARYAGIPGKVTDFYSPPEGCRFHARCDLGAQNCGTIKPALREIEKNHFVACDLR